MPKELRATRYLTVANQPLAKFIVEELPYLEYEDTMEFYARVVPTLDQFGRALLAANDRFFLLTGVLRRTDALHPWLFDRCREVEADPDNHIDLWARYHYKSTIITFAGTIQEIICDPEITVAIFSYTKPIANAFLNQIMDEAEQNPLLPELFPDVFWTNPRKEAPKWGLVRGIVVRRKGNPKEATVEAWGLIDGQPISRHYMLRIYDDIVTDKAVTNEDMIKKTTRKWELSDNLASTKGARKWMPGTRYHFGDTYGVILKEGRGMKPRIYAATDNGKADGKPVFLTDKRWAEIKDTQRSTLAAQMLMNPLSGNESTFKVAYFRPWFVRPSILNVYILVDPSKGRTNRSDRTAIAVIGIDVHNNKYLLDGVRHRMKLSERWRYLKNLYVKWSEEPGVQIVKVGYEVYGLNSDVEYIRESMERENIHFPVQEVSWVKEGNQSKNDRIERLEPDMREGRFFISGLVHYPDMGGRDGGAYWSVNEVDEKVEYRPAQGPTREMRAAEAQQQFFRIVKPIKRLDEDRNAYDVTRAFMEEAELHPFSPKDDFIDACSRLYDMQPTKPVVFEARSLEAPVHPDS